MAMTLDELTKNLKYGSYTPLTEEQIQQQAKNKFQTELDQQKLTAQQAYDKTALALDDQRAKLDQSYAQQEDSLRKNIAKTYSAADRHALTRGMQRSTYNESKLANINQEGDQALADLSASLRADQQSIDSKKAQATEQLAQQFAQYDANNRNQVAAYADELREKNYAKTREQEQYYNELQAMLYEYGLQNKKSSGGSRPISNTDNTGNNPPGAGTNPGGDVDADLFNALNTTNSGTKVVHISPSRVNLLNRSGAVEPLPTVKEVTPTNARFAVANKVVPKKTVTFGR